MSNVPFLISNRDVKIPQLIYGTAWKKEQTTPLVLTALEEGFRGIDTACQPKHYREDLVGEAVAKFIFQGGTREQLFLQTKFTPLNGQDPNNIPYDPSISLSEQVEESLTVSLKNLQTSYLDSLVLHSPLNELEDFLTVWRTMESLVQEGKVRQIGLSNCYSFQLFEYLCQNVVIKPSVLQNRFYAQSNYDKELRHFCDQHQIYYQSFWSLTANPHILAHPTVIQIANHFDKTAAQIFFRYLSQKNIIPLSGTTDRVHMQQDLAIFDFALTSDQVEQIDQLI